MQIYINKYIYIINILIFYIKQLIYQLINLLNCFFYSSSQIKQNQSSQPLNHFQQLMNQINFSIPPSHKTFQFGPFTIDSNFDSGNLSNAQKVSTTTFNIWIGSDHPQNNYRTWFYFSFSGAKKGTTLVFQIKNMQNQSRLLNQGLVPVYRYQNSQQWKRINQKVNTSNIVYQQGWIEWQFKHLMTQSQKVYFAFFYPWSNQDNSKFLSQMAQCLSHRPQVYFQRTTIINSWEGRPIQFITLSSKKGLSSKDQPIQDQYLFANNKKPKYFPEKKGIVLSARVHPGQVPGSHVMIGILKALIEDDVIAERLLQRFVFYIYPILNPDGVARGHYRVDPNGVNLNRYYINPSPKMHSPIYAVKQFIMHLHSQNRFFAFLDLHAHAARKGTFIYGNYLNQLNKQVDACLFPKILSMNSQNFEYQGSNFTEKNMYCKDRADKVSKQGSGRVAIYKATKNAYSWTLECNYNCSKVHNILQLQKKEEDLVQKINEDNLNTKLIIDYKYPNQKQAKGFFNIQTYHKLGKQICQSFLDLIQANPFSRIDNPKNHFKSVQNLKMNLAIALLRMAPNRFQSNFKKIFYGLGSESEQRLIKALYFLIVRQAKIQNLNSYVKDKNDKIIILPQKQRKRVIGIRAQSLKVKGNSQQSTKASIRISRVFGSQQSNSSRLIKIIKQQQPNQQKYQSDKFIDIDGQIKQIKPEVSQIIQNGQDNDSDQILSIQSDLDENLKQKRTIQIINKINEQQQKKSIQIARKSILNNNLQFFKIVKGKSPQIGQNQISPKVKMNRNYQQLQLAKSSYAQEIKTNVSRVVLQINDLKLLGIDTLRNSLNHKNFNRNKIMINNIRFKVQELPSVNNFNILNNSKGKAYINKPALSQEAKQIKQRQPKLLRKGVSAKECLLDAQ